jgi:hypothetical protein
MEERVPGEFETGLSAFKGHPLGQVENVAAAPAAAAVQGVAATLAELDITDAEQLLAAVAVEGMRAEIASLLNVSDT